MRRSLSKLEVAGLATLQKAVNDAQAALSEAVQSLGFQGGQLHMVDGNVLTDEDPDAQPSSTDH